MRVDILKHIPVQAQHFDPDVDRKCPSGAVLHIVQDYSAIHGLHTGAQQTSCMVTLT